MDRPASFFTALLTSLITSVAIYFMLNYVLPPPEVRQTATAATQAAAVPNLEGLEPKQASTSLQGKGLLLYIEGTAESAKVPVGRIVSQRPLPESALPRGESVRVVLSEGSKSAVVPDLKDLELPEAKAKLRSVKLKPGAVTRRTSKVPAGVVISQKPPAGSTQPLGAAIALEVSAGLEMVKVPKATFRHIRRATKEIQGAGLIVGQLNYTSNDDYDDNTVIRQNPKAGVEVAKGSKIDLTVVRY